MYNDPMGKAKDDETSYSYAHSFFFKIMVNAASGLFAELMARPFFTIWTVQHHGAHNQPLSFIQACKIIRKGKGFYAGFSISLIFAIPGTTLYLIGKDIPLALLGDNDMGQIMRGPCAQAFGIAAWAPETRLTMLEQVSGNIRASHSFHQLSLFEKSKAIWKENGLRGFYRGTFPWFCACAISDGLGFWLQAKSMRLWQEEKRDHFAPQVFTTMFAFGIAAIVKTPVEVTSTRLMIAESNPAYFSDKKFLPAIKTIYRQGGIAGFFTGVHTNVMHDMMWYLALPCADVGNAKIYSCTV